MKLEIDGWDTGLRFSAAHFIPSHDKCSRLHGHDYCISISVTGENDSGFVIDFDILKQRAMDLISRMDHRVIVPSKQDRSRFTREGGHVNVEYDGKSMSFAESDVYFLDAAVSSSEEMSTNLLAELVGKIREFRNVRKVEVCLFEGPGQGVCSSVDLNEG